MLGRRVDGDLVVLARDRQCDVAFEIEVLLASNPHFACQPVRGRLKGGICIAIAKGERLRHQGVVRIHRTDHVGFEGQVLVVDFRQSACPTCGIAGLGNDCEDGLSVEGTDIISQNGFVVKARGTNVVLAGHVVGSQHHDHTRCIADGFQIHRHDAGTGAVGQTESAVERAGGFMDVIDIFRRAGNVLVGGFMRPGRVNTAGNSDAVFGDLFHSHATAA